MGTTPFSFIRFNNLRKFCFDSTHDSQWLYKNWFNSDHGSKWISEVWFKSTHDSKRFHHILIQISYRLKTLPLYFDSNPLTTQKNFPEFRFKSIHDSKHYLKYWFEWSHDSMIRINSWFRWPFLGLTLNFVDLFWAFTTFRWLILGFH